MKLQKLTTLGEECLRLCCAVIVLTVFTYTNSYSQVNQQKILDYDDYGNPIEVQDANGNKTKYYYGSNTAPFQNATTTGSAVNGVLGVYLTGIQKVQGTDDCASNCGVRPVSGDDLFTEAVYDDLGRLITIIDENNQTSGFGYDAFNRLHLSFSPGGTQSMHEYYYSELGNGGSYNNTDPNSVRQVTLGANTSSANVTSHPEFTSFNGNNDVVNLGDVDYMDNASQFSISMWFMRSEDHAGGSNDTNHGVNNVLIAQSSSATNDNLEIGSEGQNLELYMDTGSGTEDTKRSVDADITNDVWYHLVLTYSASTDQTKLYLDGQNIKTWTEWQSSLANSGSSPITLGLARPNVESWGDFEGNIADVRIFDHVVNAGEVSELYGGIESVTYFDGLGRPIQTQQSTGGDAIVQHTFYDAMGRKAGVTKPIEWGTALNYVPVSTLMGSEWTMGDPVDYENGIQFLYYYQKTSSQDAMYSYSQTAYEASPLGRVIKQAAPGNTYKLSGSRTIDFEYDLNTLNNEDFGDPGELGFGNNMLQKQEVTDENGNKSWQFTDGWGRTIMEVVDHDGNNLVSSSAADDIFTGYEYDLLGNLLKVHEPKGWGSSNYKREYRYDRLGRMTSENSPDLADSTEYKYDNAGNLRFVRNAEHKKPENCSSFNLSLYYEDIIGPFSCNKRGIVDYDITVGTQDDISMIFEFQKNASVWTTIDSYTFDEYDFYYGASGSEIISDGTYRLKPEITYDASHQQWGGSVSGSFKPFRFTYNKYDELGRIIETGEYYGSSSNFTDANAESASFPNSSKQPFAKYYYDNNGYSGARNLKGRLVRAEYFDPNSWVWGKTWYSYNDAGQIEWIRQDTPSLSTKLIEYSYNRQGQITEMNYQPNSSSDKLNIWYDYDAAGRLYQVWSGKYSFKTLGKLEATYSYNADGQVAQQSLGGDLSSGAQLIENEYHIRGWLSQINDPNDLSTPSGFPSNRFALDLNYEASSNNSVNWQAQYNGNISQAWWTVSPPNTVANNSPVYNYQYDEANQLTMADYHHPNAGTYDYDVRSIGYDKSGNFTALRRYQNSSSSDYYSYRYYSNTNRLMNVAGSSTAQHYTYDRLGNMVANQDRDITSIAYNGSNLPTRLVQKVNSSTANLHEYSYDSEGNRVGKRFNRSYSNTTNYVRGANGQVIAVYQGSTLQFWNLPGGIGRVTK